MIIIIMMMMIKGSEEIKIIRKGREKLTIFRQKKVQGQVRASRCAKEFAKKNK